MSYLRYNFGHGNHLRLSWPSHGYGGGYGYGHPTGYPLGLDTFGNPPAYCGPHGHQVCHGEERGGFFHNIGQGFKNFGHGLGNGFKALFSGHPIDAIGDVASAPFNMVNGFASGRRTYHEHLTAPMERRGIRPQPFNEYNRGGDAPPAPEQIPVTETFRRLDVNHDGTLQKREGLTNTGVLGGIGTEVLQGAKSDNISVANASSAYEKVKQELAEKLGAKLGTKDFAALSDIQSNVAKEFFKQADAKGNHDGKLNAAELEGLFKSIGMSEATLKSLNTDDSFKLGAANAAVEVMNQIAHSGNRGRGG